MNTGKTLLVAAVLAAAPFTISAVSAQNHHSNPTDTMQSRDRPMSDRNQSDQRVMPDRTMRDHDMRDHDMRDHDMRDRDMRDRDHRDMRHYGWHRGHHYGWRHCTVRWHHHHRVRICR